MDASRKPYDGPHMRTYPEHAHLLPEDVYTAAYDEDDPPVQKEIPRLASIALNHDPMRSTSMLLKKEREMDGGLVSARTLAVGGI